ncbi:MAG: hypothetical protein HQL86_04850 [Magnetococcales bacterium]|nr:hypothetical protein [Magnetococcales bacterium]
MEIAWPTDYALHPTQIAENKQRQQAEEVHFEAPDRPRLVQKSDRVTLSDPGVTRGRLVVPVLFSPHALVEQRIQGMVNGAMSAVLHESLDLPNPGGIRQEVVVKG